MLRISIQHMWEEHHHQWQEYWRRILKSAQTNLWNFMSCNLYHYFILLRQFYTFHFVLTRTLMASYVDSVFPHIFSHYAYVINTSERSWIKVFSFIFFFQISKKSNISPVICPSRSKKSVKISYLCIHNIVSTRISRRKNIYFSMASAFQTFTVIQFHIYHIGVHIIKL